MKSFRLLLVEDDADSAEAMRLLLRMQGIEVIWASSASEALALYEADPKYSVDLILLDLMLPDMDGAELVSRLAAITKALPPIVLHTAAVLSVAERAGDRIGATAVLRKPTDWKQLKEVLERAIHSNAGAP